MQKRLYKNSKNAMLSGVCYGIAEYFNVDPSIVRLAYTGFTLISCGTALVLYLVAAVILPEKEDVL